MFSHSPYQKKKFPHFKALWCNKRSTKTWMWPEMWEICAWTGVWKYELGFKSQMLQNIGPLSWLFSRCDRISWHSITLGRKGYWLTNLEGCIPPWCGRLGNRSGSQTFRLEAWRIQEVGQAINCQAYRDEHPPGRLSLLKLWNLLSSATSWGQACKCMRL